MGGRRPQAGQTVWKQLSRRVQKFLFPVFGHTGDQLCIPWMEFASDVVEVWLNLKMAYQLEFKSLISVF